MLIPDYFQDLRVTCLNLFRNKKPRTLVKSLVDKNRYKPSAIRPQRALMRHQIERRYRYFIGNYES